MKPMNDWIRAAAVAAFVLFLAACGGGGGSSAGGNNPGGTVSAALFETVLLEDLGGSFSAGVAVNNAAAAEVVGFSEDDTGVITAASWILSGPNPVPTPLLPLDGNRYSAAYGINDAGVAVGESGARRSGEPDRNTVAVFWGLGAVEASPLELDADGIFEGGASAAYGINSAGRIVGEAAYNAAGDTVAILWPSSSSPPLLLPHLSSGGTPASAAYFISASGRIVGESRNSAGRMQAVVWIPDAGGSYGPPIPLQHLFFDQAASVAFGIDVSGRIVGEVELADGTLRGAIWEENGRLIADLGTNTSASSINNADRIVGFADASAAGTTDRAFVWNADDEDDKQGLATAFSQAYGVNDRSQIVGISGNRAVAFLPQ